LTATARAREPAGAASFQPTAEFDNPCDLLGCQRARRSLLVGTSDLDGRPHHRPKAAEPLLHHGPGIAGALGELRGVGQLERRLIEAHRLGFIRAVVPGASELRHPELKGMQLCRADAIADALAVCFAERPSEVMAPA
jgi:hypothetical protein